jgi:acetyl-CoA acetyltransferase
VDLAVDAASKALAVPVNLKPDHLLVSNMLSAASSRQVHLGGLIASALPVEGLGAFTVEAGAAAGGAAVHAAVGMVKSGLSQATLVVGVEKMRDLEPADAAAAIGMAESADYTQFIGASPTALHALLARLYMEEFAVTRDQLSAFPVLAHAHAVSAPHAQFRKRITTEDVAKSPPASDPLRLLDCAPFGDGAAAVLLVNRSVAEQLPSPRVEIVGSAAASDTLQLAERQDPLEFVATRRAATEALRQAGASISNMDFCELHDAYSVGAALAVEAVGLSKKGEAAQDAAQGAFALGGSKPIATFGGLKGRGHPVGATGIYQLAEAYFQLRQQAGPNQVPRARAGLTQSSGGVDVTATVHVVRVV